LTPKFLLLVSVLSTGYIAHYNAPKFFYELKDRNTSRFGVVVNISFVLAAITYICISSLGFLTFGGNAADFILNNYSTKDPLASISRSGIAMSVIFAYPLIFLGGRDGVLDLIGVQDRSLLVLRWASLGILIVITILAIVVHDLDFVLAFGGATLSTVVTYILPPLMFRAVVEAKKQEDQYQTELWLATAMIVWGVITGSFGMVVALRSFKI